MNYISAEQFQEQPKKVQEVLLKWWKPSIGDLFTWIKNNDEHENDLRKIECCNSENIVERTNNFKGISYGDRIPLLTEGQLREFIGDKTKGIASIGGLDDCHYGMLVMVKDSIETCKDGDGLPYFSKGKDILQLYWQVACKIAEEIANE